MAVADLDGDRVPDLVTANRESIDVSVLLGNGDGSFQAASSFPAGADPASLAVVEVNGDGACDLYKYLTALETKPQGAGDIGWNFEKFLIDRSGKVINRFSPRTAPDDVEVIQAIEAALTP